LNDHITIKDITFQDSPQGLKNTSFSLVSPSGQLVTSNFATQTNATQVKTIPLLMKINQVNITSRQDGLVITKVEFMLTARYGVNCGPENLCWTSQTI
jgi:hypothetical protein